MSRESREVVQAVVQPLSPQIFAICEFYPFFLRYFSTIDQIAVHSALATDTGGSTRLPASYCGILGFKPSYGLLSRFGVVAYASSLDTVGLMSKEVHQIRQVFRESHLPASERSLLID